MTTTVAEQTIVGPQCCGNNRLPGLAGRNPGIGVEPWPDANARSIMPEKIE